MSKDTKISIIIPVYNTAEYLRRCLDSCVYQSIREIEVIVVCDCSPDIRDKQIINEYERNYPDMVRGIFHKQNLGAGESRNSGIRAAKGEFLIFCDSDDFLMLNACETMYAAASSENADVVVCNYYYMRDGMIGTRSVNAGIELVSRKSRPLYLSKSTIWVMMIKKTLVEDNELFFPPNRLGEDCVTVLWYSAAKNITKINIPLYYYVYRKSSLIGSASAKESVDVADAYIHVLNYKYFKELDNEEKQAICYSIFRRILGYWVERLYKIPQGDFRKLFKCIIDIKRYCNGFYTATSDIMLNWETTRINAIIQFAERSVDNEDFNECFRHFYSNLDIRITESAVQKLCENLRGKRIVFWAAGSYGRICQECLNSIGVEYELTDINADSLGYKSWDNLKDITDTVLVSSSEFVEAVKKMVSGQNSIDEHIDKPFIEVLDLQKYLNENCRLVLDGTLFI